MLELASAVRMKFMGSMRQRTVLQRTHTHRNLLQCLYAAQWLSCWVVFRIALTLLARLPMYEKSCMYYMHFRIVQTQRAGMACGMRGTTERECYVQCTFACIHGPVPV